MIKIVQVKRTEGEVNIIIEYSHETETRTIGIEASEIVGKMRSLKRIIGRKLTFEDLKAIIVKIINDKRAGLEPLIERFVYEDYIGVELKE